MWGKGTPKPANSTRASATVIPSVRCLSVWLQKALPANDNSFSRMTVVWCSQGMKQAWPDACYTHFNSLAARESLLRWAFKLNVSYLLMKENLPLPNNSLKTCEREENAKKQHHVLLWVNWLIDYCSIQIYGVPTQKGFWTTDMSAYILICIHLRIHKTSCQREYGSFRLSICVQAHSCIQYHLYDLEFR